MKAGKKLSLIEFMEKYCVIQTAIGPMKMELTEGQKELAEMIDEKKLNFSIIQSRRTDNYFISLGGIARTLKTESTITLVTQNLSKIEEDLRHYYQIEISAKQSTRKGEPVKGCWEIKLKNDEANKV